MAAGHVTKNYLHPSLVQHEKMKQTWLAVRLWGVYLFLADNVIYKFLNKKKLISLYPSITNLTFALRSLNTRVHHALHAPFIWTNCAILVSRMPRSLSSLSRFLAMLVAVTEAARTAQLERWSGCACTAFWEAIRPARVLIVALILAASLSWLRKAPEPTIPAGWIAGLC